MAKYDYKQGKNRVESILDNYMKIEERDSTALFSKNDEDTAKLVRAFTSEIIEILRVDDNLREIGIRGDCVYAIYTTPNLADELECANKTFYVNTFINMFNKLLEEKGIGKIRVGIGMATDKELVVKAGRKGVDINNKVWIGKAVTVASKLSSYGDKDGYPRLFHSTNSYNNFIEELEKKNIEASNWFHQVGHLNAYYSNVIIIDFNNWVDNGFS